jgi:UDP-N-acetylmuramoyl-tripeptide--D-alanyl-D-alanine ligase
MYEGAMEAVPDNSKTLFHFNTRDELIKALPNLLNNADTILVKASHFMGFDNIVNILNESI